MPQQYSKVVALQLTWSLYTDKSRHISISCSSVEYGAFYSVFTNIWFQSLYKTQKPDRK